MSSDARVRLAEISTRAGAATEGPWSTEPDTGAGRVWVQRAAPRRGLDCEPLFAVRDLSTKPTEQAKRESYAQRERDAAFIAAARADVPALVAGLTAALDLVDTVKAFSRQSDVVLAVEFEQAIAAALGGDAS